jgi:hypothetical protein
VWRFSRICTAQPHFADEMLRLILGLRCPRPSPKRGTRTGFYHYCHESDLARQLNRSVRTPFTVSRRVGRLATHQNLAAFRIDSVHAWLAQKERKPPANFPLFWPMAQTRFPETVPSSSKQTCRAVPTSGLSFLGLRPAKPYENPSEVTWRQVGAARSKGQWISRSRRFV